MASIVKRGPNHFHVRIRQRGYPTQCKTFKTREDARACDADRGVGFDATRLASMSVLIARAATRSRPQQ